MATKVQDTKEVRARIDALTSGFRKAALFLFCLSGIINLLALTGSFYMMQVYDRALTSASVQTLAMISVLAVGLYVFQGGLDVIRSQILVRIGAELDRRVAPEVHRMTIDMPRFGFSTTEAMERGRYVEVLRNFFGSQGLIALFDLPWMPIFLVFVYFLHPMLGALTIGGAVLLTILAILNEVLSRKATQESQKAGMQRGAIAESNARNADVIKAMGFGGAAVARFNQANESHLDLQTGANDVTGTLGAISKVLRMIMQSAVLGLGAYLTIIGEMSAGSIIAASIASARALAPIDMVIGNWKNIVLAHTAYRKIQETIRAMSSTTPPVALPAPKSSLKIDNVTVAAPSTGRVILSDISFELTAGQALGIIGPSGGGKSTLMRAMAGVWPALRGSVRLDGADHAQWSEEMISKTHGYLPQDYALFDTTIARNISRLQEPDADALIKAATDAGVHEMIVHMPDGYDTHLGPQGTALSGGQRQRIALARALYGDPFIVMLDEPNSNLDAQGEAAVSRAIKSVKARGGIAVVIAHRPSALDAVDLVAVVQNGKIVSFGPKDEVLGVRAVPSIEPAADGQASATRRAASVQAV